METILNYNFNIKDIEDEDFKALFEERRRDSAFALVFKKNDSYIAIRDHLGIVPIFYCQSNKGLRFSTNLNTILPAISDYSFNQDGLLSYLGFGTTKLSPILNSIKIIPPGSAVKIHNDGIAEIVYQYKIKPRNISLLSSFDQLVENLDKIFLQSIQRQVKNNKVALCLSGGIDSGLIGIYLKKLGVEINAFTAATRGADEEFRFFQKNCEIIQPQKITVDELRQPYDELSNLMLDTYGQPYGNLTGLAMTSLWNNTNLREQQQIFFGQNSDVINSAMDNDNIPLFGILPKKVREIINTNSSQNFNAYTNKMSGQFLKKDLLNLGERYSSGSYTNYQLNAIAGMYIKRTPVDSELFAQPAINYGVMISNPYYDMDFIEFALGVPIRHKFVWKNGHPSLDKRLMQKLALKNGLPEDMVHRKKGFTVSRKTNESVIKYFYDMPQEFSGINLKNDDQRFAAYVLNMYMKRTR